MKQIILLLLAGIIMPCIAQRPYDDNYKESHLRIEEYIPDLKASQRTQLDIITRRSEKQNKEYRTQLRAVRDSIHMYMALPDDHSKELYPLFDRESQLINKLNKSYYQMKVSIDAVLTPEQIKCLQTKMEKERAAKRARSREQ